jgi:hypothetical protein
MNTLQHINDAILATLYWCGASYYHFMMGWITWSQTLPSVFECLSLLGWGLVLVISLRGLYRAPVIILVIIPGAIWRVIQTNAARRATGKTELKHSLDTYVGLDRLQDKVRI